MRKLKILFAGLALIALFATISCKKTTNNTTVKQDSVFYSSWAPLQMNGFIDNNNDTFYTQSFVSRSITADVVAKGLVIGYLGYPDGTGDTVVENASEFAPTLQQLFVTDSIVVQSFGGTSGPYFNYDPSSGSGFLYRYVIIPGNVAAGTSINGLTQAQLKKISYPDLTKALNTPVKSAAAPTTVN